MIILKKNIDTEAGHSSHWNKLLKNYFNAREENLYEKSLNDLLMNHSQSNDLINQDFIITNRFEFKTEEIIKISKLFNKSKFYILDSIGYKFRTTGKYYQKRKYAKFIDSLLSQNNVFFIHWEKFSQKNIQKEYKNMFFDIPDVVDLEITDNEVEYSKYDIGFYGALTLDRGIRKLALIALFNRNLSFNVRGKVLKNRLGLTTSPISFYILKRLSNVNIVMYPFSDEKDLNAAIKSSRYMFFDNLNYPSSSSIVMKSLSYGTVVLGFESDSEICDYINYYGGGILLKYFQIFNINKYIDIKPKSYSGSNNLKDLFKRLDKIFYQ